MKKKTTSKLLCVLILLLCNISLNAQKSDYAKWEVNINKGLDLVDSEKYEEALPYLETAYEIAQKTITQKDEEYGVTVYELANNYKNLKEYPEAIDMYLKSINYLKLNNQEEDPIYAERLHELGVVYRYEGNYDKAVESLTKSLEATNNSLGKQNFEYANTLMALSIVYKKKGEFTKAIESNLESNKIIENLYGLKSKEYAQNLTLLSQIYSEIGNYEKAIPIQENVLNSYLEKDKNSVSYAVAIYTMALLYGDINEYNKEIPLYNEVIQILGEDHQGSISSYNNIGQAYDHLGDYEKALFYTQKAISKTNESDPELPTRLQNLAFIYVSMGNYDKALEIYNNALEARINISGKDHYLYGQLINTIGKLHQQKGDLEKAELLYLEALDNLLISFDENYIDYGYYLNDYASVVLLRGDTKKAITLLKNNISIFEKNGRTGAEDYFKAQYLLAKAYNETGNYTEALALLLISSENIQNLLGSEHPTYGRTLESLSDSYIGLGEVDKAISTVESLNNLIIRQLDKIFKFRSEKEKKDFLNIMINNFDRMQSISFNNNLKFEKLNDINLNNQLMLKGLLLNDSKSILNQLSTLNDSSIDNKLISYQSLKKEYTKLLSLPIDDRVVDIDSLKENMNTKESELVKLYSINFKNNIYLSKDWKLPQSKLSENDIAIEYSSFHLINNNKQTDSIMYVAYVYKKDWQHSKMIPLFEEKELINIIKNKSPNELYNSKKLYDLVWSPLTKYMDNESVVYFSPSGLLNQISFAALKGESAFDTNSLVRLSSTSVLSEKITKPTTTNTLFIGAINYDYTKTTNKVIEESESSYLNTDYFLNSTATRSRGESWNELPGTLKEINELQSILNSKGYKYTILTGNKATESQFKKLSGNSPNILHIATHGYFYENLNIKSQRSMNLSTEDAYRLAEDPLLRSGLIFAGANYAWKNGVNPNEEEDGILNAMEISNLDLSNTSMVVLSACETGLGDIDGSEGVYGLQRAFKMAGVDIIVMSLWQVPDLETAEFMSLFYTDWLSGKEVRKAFNNTQHAMQKKYVNEPLKWAAFVLFE